MLAVYEVTRDAVDRARRGEGVTLVELMTYRRKGHAEHDNQCYVPAGEIERWARENDPIDRYVQRLTGSEGVAPSELEAIDARVRRRSTTRPTTPRQSPPPEPRDCLVGVYADPPAAPPLWYREGVRSAVDRHERPASWGTHDG